jgi:RNA polymerase sigma-70 factor (sigma-E family)
VFNSTGRRDDERGGGNLVGTGQESGDDDVAIATLALDFESVYRANYRRMVGLARTVLASNEGAEEVVQEAFARVFARWEHVEHRDDPVPYVRSAVLNQCRGRFRKGKPHGGAQQRQPSAEQEVLSRDRDQRLYAAVAKLPMRQREVVALRYFAEMSTNDTADALGIASGTVKAHLHRAVEALSADLEELRHD